MRTLLVAAAVAALALPAFALADDAPNAAVAACKAEYAQLGQSGFAAKYGAGDAGYKACVLAHGGTVPSANKPDVTGAVASMLCRLELEQSGADAFGAKYGAGDAGKRACVQAKTPQAQAIVATCGTNTACIKQALGLPAEGEKKPDVTTSVASALCQAELRQSGPDAFAAKYGAGDAGKHACVQAKAAQAQAIVASCGTNTACIKQALGAPAGGNDKQGSNPAALVAHALCRETPKDALSACLQAAAAKAQAIVAACKAQGTGGDAFKQCVLAALGPGAH